MSFYRFKKWNKSWHRDDDDDHGWRRKHDRRDRDNDRDDDDHFHWKKHCAPSWRKCRDDDDDHGWKKKWVCKPEPEPDPNTAPEITAPDPMVEVILGQAGFITDVDATDADGDQIIFALSGDDAALFDIDEMTGEVTALQPLTLNGSADGDALYHLTVTASDVPDGATDTLDLQIGITSSA